MKKKSLLTKLIFLVFGVVATSLFVVSFFIRSYVEQREFAYVKQKMQTITQLVVNNPMVKDTVKHKKHNEQIVAYTDELTQTMQIDFIVVMDTNFIRYSHPTHDIIGGVFSNVSDAQQTIEKGAHFSFQDGTLGAGIRYFDVITDENNDVIGIICVGYRKITVDQQIATAQNHIFQAFIYGLIIAIVLAYCFGTWLKRVLLGLEPEELSKLLIESVAVSNHVTEGIIALNSQRQLLFYNTSAKQLLSKLYNAPTLEKHERLDETIETLLFGHIFNTKRVEQQQRVVIDQLELVVGRSPIYIQGKFYGAVVTFTDQTNLVQLITELSQTEQYNDALRAANHHHMNQMHVLNGLLELKQYNDAEKFINQLKQNYHHSLGYVSNRIKIPAITGFLLGKQNEMAQKNMTLQLDDDSVVDAIDDVIIDDTFVFDVLLVLGVLIDNAIEASDKDATITVYIATDMTHNKLTCSVEDVGIGMTTDVQKRIFERGFSTKGQHRGFGLDAVFAIVMDRNGTIDVASQLHQGTCVTIDMSLTKSVKNETK